MSTRKGGSWASCKLKSSKISCWLSEPLPRDVTHALNRLAGIEDVAHVAVMPDVHLSEEICVGTVVASRERLYPHAVGGDIGCGMAALRLGCDAQALDRESIAEAFLDRLKALVPTSRHGPTTRPGALPGHLEAARLSHPSLETLKSREGRYQLGTLGSGNHFIELQEDGEHGLWIMLHSGSRAMGQAITKHHVRSAMESVGARAGRNKLPSIAASRPEGEAYLQDVQWASRYAEESRDRMLDAVANAAKAILGASPLESSKIACSHNHVRQEVFFGERLWIHRKGALSARQGEPGLIPGSMAKESFHVEGRGCERALFSSSHGAGRAMSRTEARRKISVRELHQQIFAVWVDRSIEAALVEEAPSAYKPISKVMRAQRELTKIVRRLSPRLSYKGV